MPSITFLGAAQTVTGSKHLLDTGTSKVLIDAGLFQGLKELRERNWQNLPIAAKDIDAIVLTHAHLDHCGYLPRLVSQGFRGRVFCTAGTKDLCGIVLPDSGRIQEEDAEQANRHGYSRHAPALPLYTESDAMHALTLLQPVGYERPMPVADGVEVEFINAGHLLGSAYARIRTGGQTILFGGDLGRFGRPVLPDPTMVEPRRLPARRIDLRQPRPCRRQRRRETRPGDPRHLRAPRPRDHSGVRGRAGRRAALVDQEARGGEADPGAAGLRRQPDGQQGACAATAPASTSSIRICTPKSRTRRRRTARPPTSHANGVAPRRRANAISAPSAPRSSAPSRRPRSRRS